ncbi:ribonuclease HI [Vulcanisaeta souniana]|uniref:Ribonuclease H n=1 Tax=Vulcanisaeta souniana JCM 11219 TaxID=1293586 RepID=A0A830E2H7_9CREN|nr:ribonuclease HI [Vulcanisaeta souniana]BDR91035.1 ribonuclease H [Vulcanisaeta souniana JCM 11219]GGI80295.1 ribonuclease H [Vulcanisaeta souniana JCM 11219]
MPVVYFDGACEPRNPGGVGTYGFVVYGGNGNVVHEDYGIACEPSPNCTNNVAEYTGLIRALEWLVGHGFSNSRLIVHGDSQLVIRQLMGVYSVRAEHLKPLHNKALELLRNFDAKLEWVPREENARADELSKKAYIEYLDNHPELVEALSQYFATEKQLASLKELGIEPYKYMSKMEANRLIRKLLKS